MGDSISNATGKVTISGHTDDVPIAFSDRFDSNWDLSAARAAAVADYFFNTTEIDDQRVSVFGYADTACSSSKLRKEDPRIDNRNFDRRLSNWRISRKTHNDLTSMESIATGDGYGANLFGLSRNRITEF